MSNKQPRLRVKIFYSYSHKDAQYKRNMETILATLRQQSFVREWSDTAIVPGESICAVIDRHLSDADIVAFLLSPDFIASEACVREWCRARELANHGRLVFRVPVIVRECPWQDFLGRDDVKVLPTDGKAIATYDDPDSGWTEVYEGIKAIIQSIRTTFMPKPAFLRELNNAGLPSSMPLSLDDIFVFPRLTRYDSTATDGIFREHKLTCAEDLRDQENSVIHGHDKSGKTTLAKHLALSLVNDSQPMLLVDLGTVSSNVGENYLRSLYETQFNGDYHLWKAEGNRTLIVDNMTDAPQLLNFLERCRESFEHVCVFASSDLYHSFLMDDVRLAGFSEVHLEPLTMVQQETLIRKRLTTLKRENPLTDGFIDQVEDRVNSIIISNRVVPRYPFFVLSILETYDTSMPRTLSITSYGHCYFVFIFASLLRAGISEADEAINAALNFAESLAWATFVVERESDRREIDFPAFEENYRSNYFIETSMVNRLTHKDYGIISRDGKFKTSYMYYYFLGKALATNAAYARQYLPELCEESYTEGNYLTLLFAIHHATDDNIVEEILISPDCS